MMTASHIYSDCNVLKIQLASCDGCLIRLERQTPEAFSLVVWPYARDSDQFWEVLYFLDICG